jgi:hypothetical protein
VRRRLTRPDRNPVPLALIGVALMVTVSLVVTLRPEPPGTSVVEPTEAVLADGTFPLGGPSAAPSGPVDQGVEPTLPAGSPSAIEVGPALPGDGREPPVGPSPADQAQPASPGAAPAGDGQPVPPIVNPAPAAPRRAAPPPPAPARYAAVSGEGCPQQPTSGYFRKGWHTDWYARGSGGWAGDGCSGRMVAVPMSGSTTADDPDNVIVWWFSVGSRTTCTLSVHVPGTGNVMDAAGAPATYFVYASADASGPAIAKFTVDQVRNQGRWVSAGPVTQSTGQLSVRMVTRGIDWGPGRAGAHHGVSALRVRC